MTDTSTPSTRISGSPSGVFYVDWPAIFAGAIIASAIIVLMTAFGSAIGLSLLSPYQGPSPKLFYIVLALWFTWITVSCFAAGGYVTGRMRRPIDGSTTHEVHVRVGATGSSFGPLWWSSAHRLRHCRFHLLSKAAPI